MSEALVASDVRKVYDETVALDGVSLSVDSGDVLALVGPNGAGKTTFVRVLTGTIRPSGGEVTVLGATPDALDRSRLGVLPQSFSPPARLTTRELLGYYAGLYDDSRDPEAVLADVGLAGDGDVRYEQLSGGQQRRLCLGSALVNDPDLVVLDEPTTGIDPAGRRTVHEHVRRLAESGACVLVTTHDMAEAEALADRVALLVDGELRATGPPDELVDEYAGDSRLVVDTERPVSEDTLTAVEAMLGDGPACSAVPEGLSVRCLDPTRIGAVVNALEALEVSYDELTWRRPDLEDVYMALAGDEEGRARSTGDDTTTAARPARDEPGVGVEGVR